MAKIRLLHTTAIARFAKEEKALPRESRERRQKFEAKEGIDDSANTSDSNMDSNSQFFRGHVLYVMI